MNRTMILLSIVWLLAAAAGCQNGELGGPAEVAATRGTVGAVIVRKGPAIDGTLASPLWQKCPALVLGKVMSQELGELKTTARVLFDGTHLYVAWDCTEPDTGSIKAAVKDRDGSVWNDDSVELFITGDPRVGWFHFTINAVGTLLDARTTPGENREDSSWNSSAVASARVEKDKRWTVTLSVPLKELGAYVGEGQTWAMNLNRTRPLGSNQWQESSWSATGRSRYRDSAGWGKIVGVRIPRRADGVTRTAQPPTQ